MDNGTLSITFLSQMKTIRFVFFFALANSLLSAQNVLNKPAPNPKPNEVILHQGTSVENFSLQLFLTDLYQPITKQQLAVQKILKTKEISISFNLDRDLSREEAINYLDKILLKEGIAMIVQGKRTTLMQGGSLDKAIKNLKQQIEFHERFLQNDDPRNIVKPDLKKAVIQTLKKKKARLAEFER